MDRIDRLGDDHARRAAFSGTLLTPDPDPVLQSIVEAAATAAGCPIALVSLVLHRLQYFRAHVGLPAELAAAPATDRCSSFCQLVVRDRAPLEVTDAQHDDRVPQLLVDQLGIRAYYGVPLVVEGAVLGTLCVLDTRARSFTAAERDALAALAPAATARLVAMLEQTPGRDRAIASQLAADLMRSSLANETADIAMARIAATELRIRLRALDRANTHDANLALTRDAGVAIDDLEAALRRLEIAVREQRAVLGVLLGAYERGPFGLRDAVNAAAVLVRARLRWSGMSDSGAPIAQVARAALVAFLGSALIGLATPGGDVLAHATATASGLELRLRGDGTGATLPPIDPPRGVTAGLVDGELVLTFDASAFEQPLPR